MLANRLMHASLITQYLNTLNDSIDLPSIHIIPVQTYVFRSQSNVGGLRW